MAELKLQTMALSQIKQYPNNPRVNDGAVAAVMESIRQCEYIAPIIVDENGVILAGHTRYKALKSLGRKDAQVVVKAGLTDEQKRKYRLLDNKTGEMSQWDFDQLTEELDGLDFDDFDFGFNMNDFVGEELTEEKVPSEGLAKREVQKVPDDFKEFDENIETEHECPMCGYKW